MFNFPFPKHPGEFLGANKQLFKWVCPPVRPSVGPLHLFNFGGVDVLISTAWPVLALVILLPFLFLAVIDLRI